MEGLKPAVEMVEKALREYFDGQIDRSKGFEKLLWQNLAEFTLRGAKRIRAALVLYGYQLFKKTNTETPSAQSSFSPLVGGDKIEADIIYAMMAVELFHAGLLIHDDVIDEDQVRRGLPTFHAEMADRYESSKYGESIAICAGDMAMLAAEELLTLGDFDPKLKLEAIKMCSRGIVNTAVGEALDSELQAKGEASEEEILEMVNLKTGIYTFANPLALGAVLAGAGGSGLKILEEYSLSLGIAFQMTDDVLGMFGDESKTGKAADSDIRQGKMTLLKLKVQNPKFKEMYGKKDATDEEIELVRQIVKEESLPEVKEMIESYGNEAKKSVQEMREKGWDKNAVDFLGNLVTFVMSRES